MAQTRQTTPDHELVEAPEPLNILSMRDLEHRLKIDRDKLRHVAAHAASYYRPYSLPKPTRPFAKDKKETKFRDIDNPQGDLKEIQRRIYYLLLRNLKMPPYLSGGVRKRSVLTNVAQHQNAPVIVTIDVKAWFPSITPHHVDIVWRKILRCSDRVSKLLTALTTVNGHLPQGSHCSTTIANLVLFSIDGPIRAAALAHGVTYSSYVDDLPFSGPDARRLIPIVISTLKRTGFRVSRKKLRVMGGGTQKSVNGVVIGRKPSLSKKDRDRIRAALFRLRVGNILEAEETPYIASLKGRILHLASINPGQAKKFQTDLEDILTSRRPQPALPKTQPAVTPL